MSIRLGFFITISYLLSQLQKAYETEKKLARTDTLTGVVNYRFFLVLLEAERQRFERYRHPFSLIYLDVDHFKTVNDTLGHTVGNQLLCLITDTIQQGLRTTDIVARLGGDEFAILLLESHYQNTQQTVERIQKKLRESVQKEGFPVSFSMGIVTFTNLPNSLDQMIRLADTLMYKVKQEGKNGIIHEIY